MKFHKLLMTTTAIVSTFGLSNIDSTPVMAQSTHPLVCDWVQTTTTVTNRVIFQTNGTVTIVYGLGNYDLYKWAASNSSSGTVNLTNGIRYSNFSISSFPPNRSERYALNKDGILSLLGKQYRCKK
ncbi:MAG: hypothetical protein ACKPCI_14925 [Dolichospermum sp.]